MIDRESLARWQRLCDDVGDVLEAMLRELAAEEICHPELVEGPQLADDSLERRLDSARHDSARHSAGVVRCHPELVRGRYSLTIA